MQIITVTIRLPFYSHGPPVHCCGICRNAPRKIFQPATSCYSPNDGVPRKSVPNTCLQVSFNTFRIYTSSPHTCAKISVNICKSGKMSESDFHLSYLNLPVNPYIEKFQRFPLWAKKFMQIHCKAWVFEVVMDLLDLFCS